MTITPFASVTRPSDTTAYAQGDLVANSTTAGDVTPLRFGVSKLGYGTGLVVGARLFKDSETVTNAKFNLHLFSKSPTVTNGDNGALAAATAAYYLGKIAFDLTSGAFTTTTDVIKAAASSPNVYFDLELDENAGRVIYGLLEADAAYTPASGEVFKVWLHIESGE